MTNDDQSRPANIELLLEEAETLIWALLDDRLEAADSTRLCELIEQDAAVRARYIECVQLHVDLREHFAAAPELPETKRGSSPVLSNLMLGDLPGAGSLPTLRD